MPYQNFFATKLYTDIGSSDTTITLETAPSATSGRLVLEARNATQREVIKYTGVSGNQITGVTRGQGGTSAKTHTKNSLVEMNLTSEDIQDLYDAFDSFSEAPSSGWYSTAYTPASVTYNGNQSYTLVFNAVDLTSLWSVGTKLKLTRTVSAPTQCTDLEESSSQYYSKTSPSKSTFTNNWTTMGWVKLESYKDAGIISRWDGTSGWVLRVTSTGQIRSIGTNGGSTNSRVIETYQSIFPLGKWVHIAAIHDMSGWTTATNKIYINGVSVPVSLTSAGTNPTAIVQAGNLEVGSYNGTNFMDGKLAQVAFFSAQLSEATIRSYASQGLTGSETNLGSAYSFNNSITDLNTTTPNDLTANGLAVATNADSPFGLDDNLVPSATTTFGIVTSKSFSTNTTVTVQVPEGCTIPTTGGISAVAYSAHGQPFGFPTDRGRYRLSSVIRTSNPTTSNADYGNFLGGGWALTIPVGVWTPGWQAVLFDNVTLSVAFNISPTSLVGVAVTANKEYASVVQSAAASTTQMQTHVRGGSVRQTSAQTWVMYTRGATTSAGISGDISLCEIYAELAVGV